MAENIKKQKRYKYLSGVVIVTLAALLILLGFLYLDKRNLLNLPQTIGSNVRSLLLVIGTLFTISLILRLTIKRFQLFFEEPEERIFYSKIYSWTLYSIVLFVILHHFGVSLGNITLFIGLIATGLAFAVREVLLSFFAWMVLLRKKPFRIGDNIRIGEDEGKVLHIGTFYVLLDKTTQLPEDYTRVPNRLFLEKSILNLGKTHYHEEILFPCTAIPAEKSQLMNDLSNELEGLAAGRENLAVYYDIRNEKLVLVIEYLTGFEDRQAVRSKVIEATLQRFGPYMAFPKQ